MSVEDLVIAQELVTVDLVTDEGYSDPRTVGAAADAAAAAVGAVGAGGGGGGDEKSRYTDYCQLR